MENMENKKGRNNVNNKDYYVIDILHILRTLLKRAWAILLISVITGVASLLFTVFFIDPKYASSVTLYVNNSTQSTSQDQYITSSDLSASMKLVDSYIVILESRTTIEEVIALTGVQRSYDAVKGMISAEAINETEIFRVTVTSTDPEEARIIADGIVKVLPDRIADVILGSSMRPVDGIPSAPKKVSPNVTTNTVVGVLIGFLLSCTFFGILAVLDDTIRNDDQILQISDMPILAKIPDLEQNGSHSRRHGSYYSYYSSEEQKNADESEVKTNEKK